MSHMLTALEAATVLKISSRKVYALAASGELASYRFGSSVRFDLADLEAYKAQCRSPATTRAAGSISLTAGSPGTGSALIDYFRKAGREPKPSPTTKRSQPGSTPLQLAYSAKNP